MKFLYKIAILIIYFGCNYTNSQNFEQKYLNVETIYWESETNSINCSIDIEYPILCGDDSLITEINEQIKVQIFEAIKESKEQCNCGDDETSESDDTDSKSFNYPDNRLFINFEGSSNSHFISLVIKKYIQPLGSPYTHKVFTYYNYNLNSGNKLYINDLIKIEAILELCWKKAVLNNYDQIFSQIDLYNHLRKPQNIEFTIDKEALEIYLLPLGENSSNLGEELSIRLTIDDIEGVLKIAPSILPLPVE